MGKEDYKKMKRKVMAFYVFRKNCFLITDINN